MPDVDKLALHSRVKSMEDFGKFFMLAILGDIKINCYRDRLEFLKESNNHKIVDDNF